jgi:hypothetical protein
MQRDRENRPQKADNIENAENARRDEIRAQRVKNRRVKRIKTVRGRTWAPERVRGHQRTTGRTEKRPTGTRALPGRHRRTEGARE